MVEHHIQREILDRLARAASLRFSDLRPDGMESNIFMYHLKQLMKQGYVQKLDDGYALAPKGLSYVDGLSTENHKPRQQPKLIAIIALQNAQGQWLLAERKIQPYIGTRMFPSGKQHRGETSVEHAARELHEKTGLQGVALAYRGTADIQIADPDGTLLTHVVAQVYAGILEAAVMPPETDRFRFVWHNFKTDTAALMPGTFELHEQLKGDAAFTVSLKMTQAPAD